MNKAKQSGVVRSWARARALAALVEKDSPSDSAHLARQFLSKDKNTAYFALLDGVADKRNPAVREMVKDYETFVANGARASYGDPTKGPRAGAPLKRLRRKLLPQELLKAKTLIDELKTEIGEADPESLSIEAVHKLKELCDEHGGIANVTYALAFLKDIQHES